MWNNDEYKIRLEEDSLFEHERVVLSSGECDFFFSMVFMGENGKDTAYYNCGDFVPLSNYKIEKIEDVLYVLEKTLLIVGHVAEYLIRPAKVTLTTDTVFYNIKTGEIKIAYVPVREEKESLRHNILLFLAQLKRDICDGNSDYIDRIGRLVNSNSQIVDIINSIGLFKREIYSQTKSS